jgi:hypothetical protein
MSPDDLIVSALKKAIIDSPEQPGRTGMAVDRATWRQLIEKPQSLLGA